MFENACKDIDRPDILLVIEIYTCNSDVINMEKLLLQIIDRDGSKITSMKSRR